MLTQDTASDDILSRSTRSDQLLELALLHFERLNFDQAVSFAILAGNLFIKEARFQDFLRSVNIRIRISAERNDQDSVSKIKDELQELLILQGIQLSSSTHYSFALCSFLRGQYESAEKYLLKAIDLAAKESSEEDLIKSKIALGSVLKWKGLLDQSKQELEDLKNFPLYWKKPELRLNAKLIQIGLHLQKKEISEALSLCESCHEDLKFHQSVYLKTFQLYNMGRIQKELGDFELAQTYFTVAKATINPRDLTVLYQAIDSELQSLTGPEDQPVDLSLDVARNIAHERTKGVIQFGHQFILVELLRMLMRNPGETVTKLDLARGLWQESYVPSAHDNKIYATVKRLRDLIEPEEGSPQYILRSKSGYALNKDRKVRLIS